jgi:raffinose/stachyose/melibiose transport system permease protein
MRNRGELPTYVLFTLPILLVYIAFFVAPVLLGVFYSFTDWNGLDPAFNMIGLDNYRKFVQDESAWEALIFTIKYTVLLVVFVSIISIVTGVALNGNIKLKLTFRAIYFFPAVLSMITVALVFDRIFYSAIPYLGELLRIDWLAVNLLASKSTAMWGVLSVNVWQGSAIPIALIIAGLQTIPREIYESATLDGAGALTTFFRITLPFLMPAVIAVVVITTKMGFLVFDYIIALTGGGPAGVTQSIGYLIYKKAFTEYQYSYSVTLSVVLFAVIAIFSIAQIGVMKNREASEI